MEDQQEGKESWSTTLRRRESWSQSISELLKDEEGAVLWHDFLKDEGGEDYAKKVIDAVNFWNIVNGFRVLNDNEVRRSRDIIYRKYLQGGKIVVGDDLMNPIRNYLSYESNTVQTDRVLFDAIQIKVEDEILDPPYRSFIQSDTYIDLINDTKNARRLEHLYPGIIINENVEIPQRNGKTIAPGMAPSATSSERSYPVIDKGLVKVPVPRERDLNMNSLSHQFYNMKVNHVAPAAKVVPHPYHTSYNPQVQPTREASEVSGATMSSAAASITHMNPYKPIDKREAAACRIRAKKNVALNENVIPEHQILIKKKITGSRKDHDERRRGNDPASQQGQMYAHMAQNDPAQFAELLRKHITSLIVIPRREAEKLEKARQQISMKQMPCPPTSSLSRSHHNPRLHPPQILNFDESADDILDQHVRKLGWSGPSPLNSGSATPSRSHHHLINNNRIPPTRGSSSVKYAGRHEVGDPHQMRRAF